MMEATMTEESKTERVDAVLPTTEEPKLVTLEELLPAARKLSAHDKLMLVQMLVEEMLREPLVLFPRNTVIELYSPIEVSGNVTAFEQMIQMSSPNEE